jgi:hypothetical protein
MTPLSVALRRATRRLRDEGGFGLVELMVAFVVLNVAVLGMAAAAGTTLRSLDSSKKRQQAVTLATGALEAARSLPYKELVMDGIAATTWTRGDDPTTGFGCPPSQTNTPGACELVVKRAGGVIAANTPPYRFTQNGLTVSTLVTWVCVAPETKGGQPVEVGKCSNSTLTNGANEDTTRYSKRITIRVSSSAANVSVTQSTLVSQAVRGLSGAQFSVFPSTGDSLSAPNQDQVCFPHSLKNSGSNDAYEVVFPTTAGYQYQAYLDLGTRGTKDALDTQLVDLTGNGYPNTQPLATGDTMYLLLCYTPTTLPADGSTVAMATSVRSGYDTTVARNLTHTLVYATQIDLYLGHMEDPSSGIPLAARGGTFELKVTAPDRVTLTDYDTDTDISLGKYAKRKPEDITKPGDMEWAFAFERTFTKPATINPQSVVIWTSSKEAVGKFTGGSGSSNKALRMNYRLRRFAQDGSVAFDSGWIKDGYTHNFVFGAPASPVFQPRTIAVPPAPAGSYAFVPGDRLQLLVHCSNQTWEPGPGQKYEAKDECAFAYDTTSYPAYLRVGLQ